VSEVTEPGVCTCWVRDVNTETTPDPKLQVAADDQLTHIVILQINTEHLAGRLIFRRADLAKMLAKPNDAEPYEVAVHMEDA
jgi:hypothetical protein